MSKSSYTFSLTPTSSNLYFKTPVSMDFSPMTIKNKTQDIFPKFNNDGKHYTPAFVLPADLYITKDMDTQIKQLYIQKLEKAEQSTVGISNTEACPPSQNNYCSVCKSSFGNYVDHVRSTIHKIKADRSNYKEHIEKLCDEFSSPSQQMTFKKLTRRVMNSGHKKNMKNTPKYPDASFLQPSSNAKTAECEDQNPICFIVDQVEQIQAKQAQLFELHTGFELFDLTPLF